MPIGDVYQGIAERWELAAEIYRPLARALVTASPVPLRGRTVLDLGTGTGAVAEEAEAAGARVVAADRSRAMLTRSPGPWPTVAGDVTALPIRDGGVDGALAGFVLNHLFPATALAEMARVVRPGGVILASTWAGGTLDPVKAAIDEVLVRWGWSPPEWYRWMKADVEAVSGDPGRLAAAAEDAGLVEVSAVPRAEDTGVRDPDTVVAYRLAMPQVARWASEMGAGPLAQVTREANVAVAPHVERWRPTMLVLTARVPVHPRRRAARANAFE